MTTPIQSLSIARALILVAALLGNFGAIAAETPPPDGTILLRQCTVEYERTTTVGSAMLGVLKDCLVEPGDWVKAGQILGRLRDEETEAELELRSAEAKDDVDVRLCEAKRTQALAKLKSAETLRRRNALSIEEFNLHRLEAESATLALEQAKRQFALAQIHLRKAEAAVRAREFPSPHDGVIVAVLKRPGEAIGQNDPIFRIVNVDQVRITGHVDVVDVWRVQPDQAVRVIPEIGGADLPIEREVFEGQIAFVDSRVDPETRTCLVVARIANRGGLLRSGLEARMEIHSAGPDRRGPGARTDPKNAN